MQLIHWGKTNQSIPRVVFPEGFSLTTNLKHFSNTEGSFKIKAAERAKSHDGDICSHGQMTDAVVKQYQVNNILIVNEPSNMTKYYQLLDLTVNGCCMRLLKQGSGEWYSAQVEKQLDNKV